MALALSEGDVAALLDMNEVVESVEEAFRRRGAEQARNSPRTRSRGEGSVLNVMHANLSYLGRGGLKAYMSSPEGTRFVVVLFDSRTSQPLAVMGADALGRFRTGAASGVATRRLYKGRSCVLALFGSGKQALTQALAMKAVLEVESVRVWSPTPDHREKFVSLLRDQGFQAEALGSPAGALTGAQVASAITSSKDPILTEDMLQGVAHLNLCGGNVHSHSEIDPSALAAFETVVVDDIVQAREEYGELIQAEAAGAFDWGDVVELGTVVRGSAIPSGRTLFKSGGVALEDVAVASMIYDKAMASGRTYPTANLV